MIQVACLRGKPVRWSYLYTEIVTVLNHAATWSHRSGFDVTLTSFNDHEHSANSLHPFNLALDLDVSNGEKLGDLSEYLKSKLSGAYDVLLRPSHVHIEFDIGKRSNKD